MTIEQSFFIAGRDIRAAWRSEEEDFISESLAYAKKKMTLLDYLASVSHAGNEVAVKTLSYQTEGPIIHIGSDFFSIVSPQNSRYIQSFCVGSHGSHHMRGIEIEIKEQTVHASRLKLIRQVKSFHSLLENISIRDEYAEIETFNGNVYQGDFEMFADFISFRQVDSGANEMSLVEKGTITIPIDGVVSVLYSI